MKLNRNVKLIIILGLAAALLLINYTPPSGAIAVLDTTFIVKGSSAQPVSGARIDCYQHNIWGGVGDAPSFTIYSGSGGVAHRIIAQGIYTVKVTAAGFDVYTDDLDLRVSNEVNPSRTFTLVLTAGAGGNPPAGTVAVKLYLVDPRNGRVSAYVQIDGGADYLSDGHGYALVYLSPGAHSLRFHGYYQRDSSFGGAQTAFDFTRAITVTSATTYTAYVATGAVLQEEPPAETGDTSEGTALARIIEWLFGSLIPGVPNWALLLLAILILGRR